MGDAMTVREVCEYLGVTRKTVMNYVERGKLQKHVSEIAGPHGLRVYFLRDDVEKLKRASVRLTPAKSKR